MVVRDTFLAELKTLFGLVVAGFEPGFSDPKARALPLRQSYAVAKRGYSSRKFGEKWRFKGLIWRRSGDFPMHFLSVMAAKVAIL